MARKKKDEGTATAKPWTGPGSIGRHVPDRQIGKQKDRKRDKFGRND